MSSVKSLVENTSLASVPPRYVLQCEPNDLLVTEPEQIPTIDLSLLTSGTPEERSKVVQQIGYACREWGFFVVMNHGISKKLIEDMLKASQSFFELTEEEKQEFSGDQFFNSIKYGTSFNISVDKTLYWRDYLKIQVHPHFNAPDKPSQFREISEEFCRKSREVASELLKGIALSLGVDENYIHETMEVDEGSQVLVINCYPPCPQPESAVGLPPHTDHGFLTLLIQDEIGGLQVLHNDKWVPITPIPHSIVVNTGDHMQIFTNGIYKSVIHRAVLNNKATRFSIGTANGPPFDKVVNPAAAFVDNKNRPPEYQGIKYRDYLKLQKSAGLNGRSCLDHLRT